MKTTHISATACLLCCTILLPSCQTLSEDGRKTVAQGTGAGAVKGAIFGALMAAATGNTSSLGRYAAVGAAAGGLVGAADGYRVANMKANYVKQEDFLDAAIKEADAANQKAVAYNSQLRSQVAALESRVKSLGADPKSRKTLNREIQQQQKSNEKQTKSLDLQLTDFNSCIEGEGYGDKPQSVQMRTKIRQLEKERSALISEDQKLAAMTARTAI